MSVSLSEYSVIKREFQWSRSVPSNFMSDIEYFVITSDVIKSFDCTCKIITLLFCWTIHQGFPITKLYPMYMVVYMQV